MLTDPDAYLRSLGDELAVSAKRIRQLIGDSHWLSDGTHKESLLRDMLRRHLPRSVMVTKGFVISMNAPGYCSKEQDIMVVDTDTEMPLFTNGETSVVFSRQLLATLSVKTKLGTKELVDSFVGLESARHAAVLDAERRPFCAMFAFDETGISDHVASLLRKLVDAPRQAGLKFTEWCPPEHLTHRPPGAQTQVITADCVATTRDYFFRLQAQGDDGAPQELDAFNADGLAFGTFAATLLAEIAARKGNQRTMFEELLSRPMSRLVVTPMPAAPPSARP